MTSGKLLALGCGIFEKEVQFLSEKNNWDIDTIFLDSTLHCDFTKLENGLKQELAANKDRNTLVLYGACHPLMEQILDRAGAFRIEGQNCIEMLLGKEIFMEKLLAGGFFLLEDWATRWDYLLSNTYPRCRPEIMKEIFQNDRKFILALRTPVSGDFKAQAEQASAEMQVPLQWMDVSLNHFEDILKKAIESKKEVRP